MGEFDKDITFLCGTDNVREEAIMVLLNDTGSVWKYLSVSGGKKNPYQNYPDSNKCKGMAYNRKAETMFVLI